MAKNKTILLIHGAWMTPKSWEGMQADFQKAGYQTIAPAWPYHDRDIDRQRDEINPKLGKLGLNQLVDYYQKIIENLPEKPILIGHSFGGLLVQLLIDRNLGSAGVAIDSGAPKGIISALYPTTFRSVAKVLLQPWKRVNMPSSKGFNYSFVNGLAENVQVDTYAKQVVPETTKIFFQVAFSFLFPNSSTKVNYKNKNRGPLLLISGENDHIAPPKMIRDNYNKYSKDTATDFLAFKNRTHWIIGQTGHQEISNSIINWLEELN